MKQKKTAALDLVTMCCQVLDDKKAGDITILDVSAQSSITDYLVLATATSQPHLRALRIDLEKALDAAKVHLVGVEMAQESGWLVIDAFDVMIHLFLTETRERYGLERLWRDATEVSLSKVLQAPVSKPRAKKNLARSSAKARRKRSVE
jgi:ribosome-associated protein